MQALKNRTYLIAAIWLAALLNPGQSAAEEILSRGQLLYVPVYWRLPSSARGDTLRLTVTLNIANTDQKNAIILKRVDYYGSAGNLAASYLQQQETLRPMASDERIIKDTIHGRDIRGSFLVEWESETPVSAPYVEAIMGRGFDDSIGFTSQARVLEEKK